MILIADIETDGLLEELTTIHSLVLRDYETGVVVASCTDACTPDVRERRGYRSISDGLSLLSEADEVWFHNGIKFDVPAIRKVRPGFALKGVLRDSLVVVQFRWAHIRAGKLTEPAGSHTLKAWGQRLGNFKGEYTGGWAEWSEEMQDYCEQDTDTLRSLVQTITKSDGITPEALEIEHELAEYLACQERNGWPFDMEKAVALQAKLSARREELGQALRKQFGTWQAKNGKPFVPKRDNAKLGYTAGVPVQKYKTVEFNPNSRPHIERCLREHYGWVPEEFTPSGQAKITDDTLEALSQIPEASLVSEYLLVQNRLGKLAEGKEAWINYARKHGTTGQFHVHGRVKQNHAVTHRASHVKPPVAGVPKVKQDKTGIVLGTDGGWGAECRELWTVPPGWVQVGADASGLELRCLSHYMARWDGGAYGEVVLNGDIHTTNQHAAGLKTRDEAKTFIYAFLYGEGPEACGAKFLPKTASRDQRRRKGLTVQRQFTAGLPALGYLLDSVKAKVETPGYLLMPDGRRTYIRHAHAALNSLLQAAGAIICKRWIVEFNRRLTREFGPQGWDGQWAALGWIHDEVQLAVRPEIAERVCAILVESIRAMTDHFKFRCPLDGEAKIGNNWRQTH